MKPLLKNAHKAYALAAAVLLASLVVGCSSVAPSSPTPTAVAPASALTQQAAAPVGTVYSADEYGDTISILDASTNQLLASVPAGKEPHNLQVSPDGRTL